LSHFAKDNRVVAVIDCAVENYTSHRVASVTIGPSCCCRTSTYCARLYWAGGRPSCVAFTYIPLFRGSP